MVAAKAVNRWRLQMSAAVETNPADKASQVKAKAAEIRKNASALRCLEQVPQVPAEILPINPRPTVPAKEAVETVR